MKLKIENKFIYDGLGFPILLINCPMKKIFGEWFLYINFEKLQKHVINLLVKKPASLSGNEIRFIRKYFECTTTEFGKFFGVTHIAVLNWEKGEISPPIIDICIRFFVLYKLFKKTKMSKI